MVIAVAAKTVQPQTQAKAYRSRAAAISKATRRIMAISSRRTAKRDSMERIDDLERDGLKLIQNPDKFCFGIDAVLLTGFTKVKPGEVMVDIGTGTGVIPILMTKKGEGRLYYGIEIQEDMAEMAGRSVTLNGLDDKVKIINCDVNSSSEAIPNQTADVITCNPPYMNDAHGLKNENESLAIARHEIACTLEDVIREGCRMLKTGGRYYMIHRPHRLMDILTTMRKYRLEPKRLRMVHPFADKEANMVLIEAVKDGGTFMKVESPLIVYTSPGEYNYEVKQIYYG